MATIELEHDDDNEYHGSLSFFPWPPQGPLARNTLTITAIQKPESQKIICPMNLE